MLHLLPVLRKTRDWAVLAIVLALVAELDSQRTGFIHMSQQSMERLRIELDSAVPQPK